MKKVKIQLSILLLLIATVVNCQKKEVVITTKKITDQIYMLRGKGGNIGLFVGEDGAFMIDDQFATITPKIIAAIKKITDKPVKYLVNTHWHGDHTGGNENMQKQGAVIVSHENVRKRMSVDALVRGKTKEASPKEALPVLTFTKDMMFHLNGEDILISHVHNAHTDGDAHIYFTNSNVIHMGDTYFQGKFPYIDIDSGGSINGYIASAEKAILMSDDETVIIPGHMNLSNKKELISFKNMLVVVRDRVKKAIDLGKNLEEVKADKSITEGYVKDFNWGFINDEKFRTSVYKSLKNH